MKTIRNLKQMSGFSRQIKHRAKSLGLVPTMGALHAGHLGLIRKARKENDFVVVSIFVNPVQFGPKEDLKNYPRNLKHDEKLCKKAGVDAVFYPDAADMYPMGYKTYVEVEGFSDCLCGKSRPGHFKGVTTVVTKLFNILQPDTAYFGQKDAQQALIIKKMVADLNIPVKVKVMPTLREKDGLAMSSRNVHLNKQERKDALGLYQSLKLARTLFKKGVRDSNKVISVMKGLIVKKQTAKIDYVCVMDSQTLKPVKKIKNKCLVGLAVRVGKTRLIDNIILG